MIKITPVAIALAALISTPAFAGGTILKTAPRTLALGLKANEPGAQKMTTSCGSIMSCNVLISLCAEWGGTWTETGTPGPQGEPQRGSCVS